MAEETQKQKKKKKDRKNMEEKSDYSTSKYGSEYFDELGDLVLSNGNGEEKKK